MTERRITGVLAMQVALVLGGPAAVVAAPPAAGRMLLVPVSGAAAVRHVLPLAVANGALFVAPGPMGSMIVVGMRARLMAPLMAHGILILAAPPGGCGDRGATVR